MGFITENNVLKKYLKIHGETDVVIPDGIKVIDKMAFMDCNHLTSIIIPDSVETIEERAFYYCSHLPMIRLPENLKNIGFEAFCGCSGFTSIVIPDSVEVIGENAFACCTKITSITIPDNVRTIGENVFWGSSQLENINVSEKNKYFTSYDGILLSKDKKTLICFPEGKLCKDYIIPDHITEIGNNAFARCKNIVSVTIPENVTKIGKSVFIGCKKLKAINVSEKNKNYSSTDGILFSKDNRTLICFSAKNKHKEYIIPESVTTISDYAFYECSGLASITIPENVTYIGAYSFYNCSALESITIPDRITIIKNSSFLCCFGITELTIPDSVTDIESFAFKRCESLKSIVIPASIKNIGNKIFYRCSALKSVTIKSGDSSITLTDKPIKADGNLKEDAEKILRFMGNESAKKETIISELKGISYKLTVAQYLIKKYDDNSAKEYLKKNIKKIVCHFIDNNDAEKLTDILPLEYVTKRNIDGMIEYAIKKKKPEMQVILTNYKNDNFGFDNGFDKLML